MTIAVVSIIFVILQLYWLNPPESRYQVLLRWKEALNLKNGLIWVARICAGLITYIAITLSNAMVDSVSIPGCTMDMVGTIYDHLLYSRSWRI